jgi:hypothetical protein
MIVERVSIEAFFYHIEEEESIEGYYINIYFHEEKVVCALFHSTILPSAK